MKIAINTRLLLKDKLEGIGWFTYETLKRITKNHPEHQFYFLFDRKYDEEFIFGDNVTPIVIGPQARHPILFDIWFNYSVTRTLKKIKADVFVSPDGYLSLKTKIPQLAVIHDLNFEHYPEDLPPKILKYYKKRFPQFAQKAERIVTVSNFSKNDIIDQYGISTEKIDVVYNGTNEFFSPLNEEEKGLIKSNYTEGAPYFVYVGSLHARKNIDRMLLAFDQFKQSRKSDYKFVVVGEKIWKSVDLEKTLSQLKHREDVIFTGRVSTNNLVKLVGASLGLVYVSYFEGFGIPVIEGMKSGVPVITSNVTSLPEVADNAAILVDPYSISEIAEAMEQLTDAAIQNKYIELGLKRASDFSWENSAQLLWKSIEKVLPG